MFLKKLVLHKFKRFFLSGVEHFEYIPNNNVTVIAWGNGLGKSSLLSQIHPLPADLKKDYKEDGYKYIEFSIGNDEYIASSGYVGKNKHSFIKNQIELNPSGTGAVQKQLVEEHLKLNSNIFSILLGTEVFTTMPPTTRKYWFSLLSPVDYTFPIKIWNNLRTRARDLVGSIKMFQDELIKKSELMLDKEKLVILKKEANSLEIAITSLSNTLIHTTKEDINIDIEGTMDRYDMYHSIVKDIIPILNITKLNDAYVKQGILDTEITNVTKELDNNAKLIQALDIQSSDKLVIEIESITTTIEEVKKYLPQDVIIGSSNRLNQILTSIREESRGYLNYLLQPDIQSLGSRKELLDIDKSIETLNIQANQLHGNITIIKNQIQELRNSSSHNVTCPNCSHSWHYDTQPQIVKLTETLTSLEAKYKSLVEQLDVLKKTRGKLVTKIDMLDRLIHIISNSEIKIFYKYQEDTSIETIPSLLNEARIGIEHLIQLESYTQQLETYKKQQSVYEETQKLAKQLGVSSIDKVEKTIEELTIRKQKLLRDSELLKRFIQSKTKLNEIILDIKKWYEYQHTEKQYKIISKHNELIQEYIGKLKLQLATIQKQVNESDTNLAIVDNLQKSITTYKDKLEVLSRMIEVLSPESGLIAKSINSFLNGYLSEMNNIINSVWSYNMELLPCEIDSDSDLNYKFKVKVNHDEIIEDVSKLSSSMQEIVNLAFKIVFVKYLGLANYPLILDEFGRTMDAEHRQSAYDIIDRVLSHNFNQIILVCHFESMYSRFVNADFLELKEYKNTIH